MFVMLIVGKCAVATKHGFLIVSSSCSVDIYCIQFYLYYGSENLLVSSAI